MTTRANLIKLSKGPQLIRLDSSSTFKFLKAKQLAKFTETLINPQKTKIKNR